MLGGIHLQSSLGDILIMVFLHITLTNSLMLRIKFASEMHFDALTHNSINAAL